MESSPLDQLTRTLGARRTRRAAAALLAGAVMPLAVALDAAGAKPKRKRQKRRRSDSDAGNCQQRCRKKNRKPARRRCRRRCQARPCAADRDCQAGEVCQGHRCVPDPGRCPTADTEVVVARYVEVADDYADGCALALPTGPDAVANLVHERFEELHDQFSAELQSLISPQDLADFSARLQHNRVHFEVPSSIGTFDGYFDGDVIAGYFTQVFTFSFQIVAVDPLPPGTERTLEGRWEGIIYDPTGSIFQSPFDIVVTFTTVGGELTGTLDVLGVLEDIPITDISVSESRPLATAPSGEERILPGPYGTLYSALVGWGSAHMVFSFFIDARGVVIGLDFVPDWPVPPDPPGLSAKTVLRLPFNGVWWVTAGGPRQYENHHATDPASRHACDLLIWNEGGGYQTDATANADYWAWEQPVFAPAAGIVADLANDVPDNVSGIPDTTTPGNFIVLQTAPHEFLLMGHFRQGSVAVALGEQVKAGQFIARVGNSGFSAGPHLHMQLMDRAPYPYDPEAVSLPLRFKDLLVNGRPEAKPSPVQGDFLQHAGCPIAVPAEYAAPPERSRPSRAARSAGQPVVTKRSAQSFRSPAAAPLDSPPPMPWGAR